MKTHTCPCGQVYIASQWTQCPSCGAKTAITATKPRKPRKSQLEAQFAAYYAMLASDLPALETEYRFHPVRRWRFDFALPTKRIAIEIEGGTRQQGRHTRHAGFHGDCDKYNAAVMLGWRVLRYTSEHVSKTPQKMIEDIRALINLVSGVAA